MTRLGWVMAVIIFLLIPTPVRPEDGEDKGSEFVRLQNWSQFSGSLRTSYWSSSRSLDDREHLATSALWLKAAPRLWQNVSLTVEGWVRNDQLVHREATDTHLREAYLDVHLGQLDVRLGKQIIVWGRADRLNPTDNVTPRNFTLLVPEDDDQRTGVSGVKASYYWRSFSLTGLWLPDFAAHTIPLESLAPPLTLRERTPDDTFGQWGLRLEQTGKAIDWSASFFDGFDRLPDVGFGRFSPTSIELLLLYQRIRVIGADAATTVGRYGLRAEAAYTFTRDADGENPLTKNPFFYLVMGGDRTFGEYLNVNLQYFLRIVTNFHDPVDVVDPLRRAAALRLAAITNQRDRVQHGVSLRVSHEWWNETLAAELGGVLTFPRLDFVIRPKLLYAFTDHVKGTVGADIFRGAQNVFFGRLWKNSGAYVELRYNF